MAVVKMHEASDKSLHRTAKACAEHEIKLRLAPAIEKFVNDLPESTFDNASNEPLTSGFFLDVAALPQLLIDNADALRGLLNRALVTPKPRKGEGKPRASRPAKPKAPAPESKPADTPTPPASTDAVDDVLAELK